MSYKDDVIKEIIEIEGGYVDDPLDSGGETKYGITKETAVQFGYTGQMKKLTKAKATEIYEAMYWNSIRGDDIEELSQDLAYRLFDISVNMGSKRAGEFLQRALNVLNEREHYYNDIKVDGSIGNITLSRLGAYMRKRDEDVIVSMITCMQGEFYVSLAEHREKDEKYIYGWFKQRIVK